LFQGQEDWWERFVACMARWAIILREVILLFGIWLCLGESSRILARLRIDGGAGRDELLNDLL
jgi:hypothetical protein